MAVRGLLLTATILRDVMGVWYDQHQSLVSQLFTNYCRHTRPSEDGLPTDVTIGMQPQNLISLDEESEAMQMKIVLQLSWRDPRLRWESKTTIT